MSKRVILHWNPASAFHFSSTIGEVPLTDHQTIISVKYDHYLLAPWDKIIFQSKHNFVNCSPLVLYFIILPQVRAVHHLPVPSILYRMRAKKAGGRKSPDRAGQFILNHHHRRKSKMGLLLSENCKSPGESILYVVYRDFSQLGSTQLRYKS